MSKLVYLSLGSNLGDRRENLRRAVAGLRRAVAVEAISPVYETAPWGKSDQPDFLNLCIAGRTALEPGALLAAAKQLERELGRERAERWGPRLIDIDILAYEELSHRQEGLEIPHPQIQERPFVLAPLADIAPGWRHPENGRSAAEMLGTVDATAAVRLLAPLLARPKGALAWGERTYVMGIINVTPDSFSGDGLLRQEAWLAAAVAQARAFAEAGADVLDIGGESTRPGSAPVAVEEEMRRLIPAVAAIRAQVERPISVDTYRAEVARAALAVGADWINDVWGLRMDVEMAGVAAAAGCPVILMHNRSKPKNVEQEGRLGGRYVGVEYDDLIEDIRCELRESLEIALEAGVGREQIILDPGLGFGKTVEQNLELLDRLDRIKALGYPLLVGPSRKSFIGYALSLPPEERREGTAAAVAIAIDRGADIVRVHDVASMVRVASMTDQIVRRKGDT